MSQQLLVNIITASVPAGATNYAVAHGLKSNGVNVAPTLILPAAQSVVTVVSADATNVYLANSSGSPVSVTLRCERGLSNEVDAETVTPFFQNTGTGISPAASDSRVLVANAPSTATGNFGGGNVQLSLSTTTPALPTTLSANNKLRTYMFNTRGISYINNTTVQAIQVTFRIVGIGLSPNIGDWSIIVPANTKAVVPDWIYFAIASAVTVSSAPILLMIPQMLGTGVSPAGVTYEISQFSGLQIFQ